MLQKMREHTQSLAAKVLVGLIIFVLSIFGFGAFEAFVSRDPPAATVNGDDISRNTLAMEAERQKRRIAAELGDDKAADDIDPELLQRRVLDGLINRLLLQQTADDFGLGVSRQQIDAMITSTPDFQTNGKFDPDLYRRLLSGNGQSPTMYREELGSSLVLMQLNGSLTETGVVTALERRQIAALLSQRRDVAYAVFDPKQLASEIEVDEQRVEDYYASHVDEFTTEESVDVDYVELSPAALMADPSIVVSDDDVAALYETERKSFVPQERRRASHILLETGEKRTPEQAEASLRMVKERIAKGETLAVIAKEISEDPGSAAQGGDLGFNGKGVFVPEFESALWALQPGQISDPVRTEFGVHLIQLVDLQQDTYPELATVKDELRTRLQRQHADDLYADRLRRLEELTFEAPDSLDPVKSELGLEVKHAAGVTRGSGPDIFTEAPFREAAFAPDVLERGLNSGVVEHDGIAVALRVRTRHEAVQRPLKEVEELVRTKLIDEDARQLARSKAEDARGRLAAGESVTKVADDAKVEWKVAAEARRQMQDVPSEVLTRAFEVPRPPPEGRSVDIAELPEGAVAVVVVTRVIDGDYAALTDVERRSLDRELLRRAGNVDLTSVFETVRDESSIRRI